MARGSPVTFVVMAGGSGERLWPLVRATVPKVCVCVDGERTLLQTTLARLKGCVPHSRVLIVTTASQVSAIRRTLRRCDPHALLVEPEPKNTAACLALAASVVARQDPAGIMVALPADHWIQPLSALHQSWRAAIAVARRTGQLVLIGLPPTHAHPGLGHLCVGKAQGVQRGCRVFPLSRFVEKPSRAAAERLLRRGRTYWNTGMFIGQASTFLDRIGRHLPSHRRLLEPLGRDAGRPAFVRRATAAYRQLKPVSFDSGVMVPQPEAAVIEGRFAWEDLGSWDSWARASRATRSALAIGGRNVQVVASTGARHLVATIGVDDVIVVHTPDATLVCRRDEAQSVRELVERLGSNRRLAGYT